MLKNMLKIATVATGIMVPGAAVAAVDAITTTDLNIRTGPSVQYRNFDTIPRGDHVTVFGCAERYNWCDVGWRGTRGWVSASYLAYNVTRRPIPEVAVSIGVPVIGFNRDVYQNRHYRDRSWFGDRDRRNWRGDNDRRDWRRDDDRRDARRDDDRRDWRRDDDRRDWRRDDDRRDWRRDDDRRGERRDRGRELGQVRREFGQEGFEWRRERRD